MRALALASALLLAPAVATAQDALGEPFFVETIDDGPVEVTVEVYAPEDGNPAVIARDDDGDVLMEAGLPHYLFRHAPPRIALRWVEVRGHEPLFRIEAFDADDPDASFVFLLLSPTERGTPRDALEFMWSGRRASLEAGETVEVTDLDQDGVDEVIVSVDDPNTTFCGRDDIRVAPRVWDYRAMRFRPVSLVPGLPADVLPIATTVEVTADLFAQDAFLRSVSSDGAMLIPQSQGPVPRSLYDGQPTTGWQEGVPGAGRGQFVSGLALEETQFAGVTLYNGVDGGEAGPTLVLLGVEGQQYLAELAPRGWQTISLPEPVTTSCFSVLALDLEADAETFAIGELYGLTQLDRRPLDRAIAVRLLPLLREHEGSLRETVIRRLIASAGPDALPHLADAVREADPEDQVALIETMAEIDGGEDALLALLADRVIASPGISALARQLPSGDPQLSEALLSALAAAEPDHQNELLRVLSTVIAPEHTHRLVDWVGQGDEAFRYELVEALSNTPIDSVDALALALGQGDAADQDLLRALIRIRRRHSRDAFTFSDAGLEAIHTTTQSLNGTVARLGIAAIGRFGLDAYRDTVIAMATEDPEPNLRAEALEALTRLTSDATPLIVAAMADESPTVRLAAADLLLAVEPSTDDWPRLVGALGTERWPGVRRGVLRAAIHAADPTLDTLVLDYLESEGSADIASALRLYQGREVAPDAEHFLRLVDAIEAPAQRAAAVEVIATLDDPAYRTWLAQELRVGDASTPAFLEVIEACGRAQVDEAEPDLLALLGHEETEVRRATIRSLAFFATERVREALVRQREVEADPQLQELLDDIIAVQRATSGWSLPGATP